MTRSFILAALITGLNPAMADNNPFSGARSITVTMHRVHKPKLGELKNSALLREALAEVGMR